MDIKIKKAKPFLHGLLVSSLTVIGILMLFRIIFVIINVPMSVLSTQVEDLPKAIYNALRFDLQVAAYIALLPTVVMLVLPFVSIQRIQLYAKSICCWYYMVAITILAALSAIDLGYYANFNSHISLTFFDFFDEEPLSLIQTIWDDYPVVWILLGLCVIGFVIKKISNRAYAQVELSPNISAKKMSVELFFYIAALVVCLRGSVGPYPLQVEDLIVSTDERVNNMIPNSAYMLKKALKEKSMVFENKSTDALLKEYAFSNLQEAMDVFTDKRVKLSADTLTSLHNTLFSQANDSIKQQPNVLLLCCESWSNYLMHMGSVMQCGMQKHFAEDIVFDNYQSVRNGTIATIENITISTPYQRVFRSRYSLHCLPSSIALPFHNSGYTTEFISGMDMAWENCTPSLKYQKFDKLTGKYELLAENPKADFNVIGIYDEYMLNAILHRLNKTTQQPQMIMGMTTTNHPPLTIPDNVNLPAIPKDFCSKSCFNNVGKDVVEKYLKAYQYFNTCLAHFLDEFKKSEAAKNTILIITGDHNVRAILNYNVIGKRWQNSVPLYIYLPPYLRSKNYPAHPKKWGCHYDLVATMAPFAFKNTEYMKLGNNLLDTTMPDAQSYSYNEEQTRAETPYLAIAKRKAAARELLLRLYFQRIFAEQEKVGKNSIQK